MTTRYKIAEQVVRIVSGGDISEDSSIDIREVMALVDQERNALIKSEIMDWTYTKSTTTAKGELEINGAWLSQYDLELGTDDDRIGAVYASLNQLLSTNYISLPNDAGIQRVVNSRPRYQKQGYKFDIKGSIIKTSYIKSRTQIEIASGPKVMDKKYSVSFDFKIQDSTMSDGSTTQNMYQGIRTHKISFDVNTSSYGDYEHQNVNFVRALINSPGFKKFIKDFDVSYQGHGSVLWSAFDDPETNLLDNDTNYYYRPELVLATKYQSTVENFKINGIGETTTGGATINVNNDLGFGWRIANLSDNINDSAAGSSAGENSHGILFIVNDTAYGTSFISPITAVNYDNFIDKFILENADKIAREQNIAVTKSMAGADPAIGSYTLLFEEIEPKGGFEMDAVVEGVAFAPELKLPFVVDASPSAGGYEPTIYTRMPSGGEHNSLYNRTVDKTGRKFYYIENSSQGQARLYLYKRYSLDPLFPEYIRVSYIGTSEAISDHDPYPVPGDYEKIIIKNLVEMFSIMKQAQDDMTNDNID